MGGTVALTARVALVPTYLAEVPLYGSSRVGLRRYGATGGRVVLDNRAAVDAPPTKPTDGWRYVRRAAVARGALSGVAEIAGVRGYVPGAREWRDDYPSRRNGAGAPLRSPVPDAERGTVQRDVASLSYGYSFNGKEDDASLAGAGVAQDLRRNGAGAPLRSRLYNKASARFMSVDPLMNSYPYYTPY